jgi:hypothetical protein
MIEECAATTAGRQRELDMAPELEPYFTAGAHDDVAGMFQTLTLGTPVTRQWLQSFVTTPTIIATIDAIIAAAGAALVASRAGLATSGVVVVAVVGFVVSWAALLSIQPRIWAKMVRANVPRFPRPDAGEA